MDAGKKIVRCSHVVYEFHSLSLAQGLGGEELFHKRIPDALGKKVYDARALRNILENHCLQVIKEHCSTISTRTDSKASSTTSGIQYVHKRMTPAGVDVYSPCCEVNLGRYVDTLLDKYDRIDQEDTAVGRDAALALLNHRIHDYLNLEKRKDGAREDMFFWCAHCHERACSTYIADSFLKRLVLSFGTLDIQTIVKAPSLFWASAFRMILAVPNIAAGVITIPMFRIKEPVHTEDANSDKALPDPDRRKGTFVNYVLVHTPVSTAENWEDRQKAAANKKYLDVVTDFFHGHGDNDLDGILMLLEKGNDFRPSCRFELFATLSESFPFVIKAESANIQDMTTVLCVLSEGLSKALSRHHYSVQISSLVGWFDPSIFGEDTDPFDIDRNHESFFQLLIKCGGNISEVAKAVIKALEDGLDGTTKDGNRVVITTDPVQGSKQGPQHLERPYYWDIQIQFRSNDISRVFQVLGEKVRSIPGVVNSATTPILPDNDLIERIEKTIWEGKANGGGAGGENGELEAGDAKDKRLAVGPFKGKKPENSESLNKGPIHEHPKFRDWVHGVEGGIRTRLGSKEELEEWARQIAVVESGLVGRAGIDMLSIRRDQIIRQCRWLFAYAFQLKQAWVFQVKGNVDSLHDSRPATFELIESNIQIMLRKLVSPVAKSGREGLVDKVPNSGGDDKVTLEKHSSDNIETEWKNLRDCWEKANLIKDILAEITSEFYSKTQAYQLVTLTDHSMRIGEQSGVTDLTVAAVGRLFRHYCPRPNYHGGVDWTDRVTLELRNNDNSHFWNGIVTTSRGHDYKLIPDLRLLYLPVDLKLNCSGKLAIAAHEAAHNILYSIWTTARDDHQEKMPDYSKDTAYESIKKLIAPNIYDGCNKIAQKLVNLVKKEPGDRVIVADLFHHLNKLFEFANFETRKAVSDWPQGVADEPTRSIYEGEFLCDIIALFAAGPGYIRELMLFGLEHRKEHYRHDYKVPRSVIWIRVAVLYAAAQAMGWIGKGKAPLAWDEFGIQQLVEDYFQKHESLPDGSPLLETLKSGVQNPERGMDFLRSLLVEKEEYSSPSIQIFERIEKIGEKLQNSARPPKEDQGNPRGKDQEKSKQAEKMEQDYRSDLETLVHDSGKFSYFDRQARGIRAEVLVFWYLSTVEGRNWLRELAKWCHVNAPAFLFYPLDIESVPENPQDANVEPAGNPATAADHERRFSEEYWENEYPQIVVSVNEYCARTMARLVYNDEVVRDVPLKYIVGATLLPDVIHPFYSMGRFILSLHYADAVEGVRRFKKEVMDYLAILKNQEAPEKL